MTRRIRSGTLFLALACTASCGREAEQPTESGSPEPSGSSQMNYAGFLEAAHDTQIIGWVWDKSRPDEPIEVTILDGSNVLASVKADTFRQDLLDGKTGNGKHGYVVPMPNSLKDGQPHEIHAVVSGTQFELKNSPKSYQFQPKKPGK